MKENIAIKLDEKDRKILLELETDARQSSAQIARKAKVSAQVVNYRIRQYLKGGIIRKFFAIPLFDKLGIGTYRIYLQFFATSPKTEQEMVEYIRDKMPCQWIGLCDGRWDVIARISAHDTFEFNATMDRFLEHYGKYVREKEVTRQLRHTWWPSTYGLTQKQRAKSPLHEVPTSVGVVKHDAIDLRILGILSENARMPTVEIAGKVKLSADAVHYRIKRLMREGVITQVKSYFDREKLGYQHNQIFMRLYPEQKGIKRLISFLNEFPECFFISSMVGAWDMQFGIDAKNSVEFHELFGRIKKEFPDVIREYETLIVYKEYSPNPFAHFVKN
ncbi:putative HTH-type transcriptional regulator [Candidatus Anstonella stagnisolia]|nr:putative HTH-type transcriptional regulator [Candidatus Anstonella stagnisolia]